MHKDGKKTSCVLYCSSNPIKYEFYLLCQLTIDNYSNASWLACFSENMFYNSVMKFETIGEVEMKEGETRFTVLQALL